MKGDTTAEVNVVDDHITPSKKKLRQARLPFQVISPSVHGSPAGRKRKLSEQPDEIQNKVGKTCKENDVKNAPVESVVLISDDEDEKTSRAVPVSADGVALNPYVKMVDIALKRKLRKCKTPSTPKCKKSHKYKNNNGVKEVNSEQTEINEDITEVLSTEPPPLEINGDGTEHMEPELEATQTEEEKDISPKPILIDRETDQSKQSAENEKKTLKLDSVEVTEKECEKSSDVEETKKEEPLLEHADCQDDLPSDSEVESVSDESNNAGSDKESPSLNLDTSINATPNEKRTRKFLNTTPSTKLNETLSPLNKSLTPKQVQKKQESVKKREEKERERVEREKKRQEEKEERTKQRQKEREEKEELKKKEREEKEEQKKKEKEERDRQKEKEKKEREEKDEQKKREKEEKEEQKRKEKEVKEEERKKRQEALDEEKRQKELDRLEAENKKKKAAAAFVNFFVPKQKGELDNNDVYTDIVENKTSVLSTFMVKTDMRLAPLKRYDLADEEKLNLDAALSKQECERAELYVSQLKGGEFKAKKGTKTWPLEEFKNDVIICESEEDLPPELESSCVLEAEQAGGEKLRAKLLGFCENRRPPYWGTWRKQSTAVRARRPFAKDEKILDYTCDSDEEWEDVVDGESLSGSVVGSDDEVEGDEYEVDNEFFVPHGYLSDEEAVGEDEDVMSLSPETQKAKLKYLEDEFEHEMKKPTERLKPRLYGIVWETEDAGKPDNCIDSLWNYFSKMSMIVGDIEALLKPPVVEPKKTNKPEKVEKVANANEKKKVPLLMSVPRGQSIPQRARNNLLTKFIKVAPQKVEPSDAIDLTDEPIPILQDQKETPKEKKRISLLMSVPIGQEIPAGSSRPHDADKNTDLKKGPQDTEKILKNTDKSSNASIEKKEKKRVSLVTSVPRDRKTLPSKKNNLLTSFIKKPKENIEKAKDQNFKIVTEQMEVDIVLSD